MRYWRIIVCLVVVAMVSLPLSAQFYSNGVSPAGVRWQSLERGEVEVIAPDFAEEGARRVLLMMDSLSGHIGYGLGKSTHTFPVVLHSHNAASNGISILAPARIEICHIPFTDSYATPWLRQLSVHEYRHAAQYSALFSGEAEWLYYLLGEQSLLALSGTLPFWWLEGDAVDAETQASLFGRALQPSFTMHYRAVGRDILAHKNPDFWFSGSYNRYTPSHYELGYQMVTTANTLAGEYVWDDVVDYAAHRFYTITPFEWGMQERLGYSTKELFYKTFTELNDFWDALPERSDSSERILLSNASTAPYETYRYPLWLDEGYLLAVRETFDEPEELVVIDLAWGYERSLCHIGHLNTRPQVIGDYIYWTELRQLSTFAQEMGSVMYRVPKDGSRSPESLREWGDYVLYPTDYKGQPCWVRYNLRGTYTIVSHEGEFTLPAETECHGLASSGERLYYIATDKEGMSIIGLNPADGSTEVIKPASRVTLSDLVASNGKLYFGSIASGYDEVHSLDLSTGREERLTTSRYGSFYGSPSPDGKRLAMATYDAGGYHLALSPATPQEVIANTPLPRNVVNPEVYRWEGFPCIDTFDFAAAESASNDTTPKPYSKVGNMLNFHSWAPIYYRPEQLASGQLSNVRLGITATSASLLSDAITTAGVFLLPSGGVGTSLNFKYLGLTPKFELNASVDSGSTPYTSPSGLMMSEGDYSHSYDNSETTQVPTTRGYYSLYGRVYLPWVLSHSYWTSTLTPSVELSHSNAHIYSPLTESYSRGQTIVAATLQWNNYTRSAYRNLQPRWGFAVIGGVGKSLAPFATTTTVGLLARAYTPAFGVNDGFTLKASYMGIEGSGPLGHTVDFGWLTPRGLRATIYPDDRVGYSVQYDTPICYPDAGLSGIVMLKRIRASLFVEGLYGRLWTESGARLWRGTSTFGSDVWFDTSWLRLPKQGDITFRVGFYFDPTDLLNPTISGGFNLNF